MLALAAASAPLMIAATPQAASAAPITGSGNSILNYAQDLYNGTAEKYWAGGKIPYQWGGGHLTTHPGPSNPGTCSGDPQCKTPVVGLDCSGFARYVYYLAFNDVDVLGSGNTNSEMSKMIKDTAKNNGDLVFFSDSTGSISSTHVGVYAGNGMVYDEFGTGYNVRYQTVSSIGLNVLGYYYYGG